MSIHMSFYEEITKIIPKLSSNTLICFTELHVQSMTLLNSIMTKFIVIYQNFGRFFER